MEKNQLLLFNYVICKVGSSLLQCVQGYVALHMNLSSMM